MRSVWKFFRMIVFNWHKLNFRLAELKFNVRIAEKNIQTKLYSSKSHILYHFLAREKNGLFLSSLFVQSKATKK